MASHATLEQSIIDVLPWRAPNTISHASTGAAARIVEARRCTVQLDNGFLYLDALATPATALLGHDRPAPGTAGVDTITSLLSDLDRGYRCIALVESAGLAKTLGVQCASQLGRPRLVEAGLGEPAATDEITVAVEKESLARCGDWLASSSWLHKPEIIVIGESLTLGVEFGAVLMAGRIAGAAALDSAWASSAPPESTLALAAAVIATVEREHLIERGRQLAAYFRERMEAVHRSCSGIVSMEVQGLRARLGFGPNLPAVRVKKKLCERGVLVGVGDDGFLLIKPPLATRPAEIDVICGALRGVLSGTPISGISACCPACELIET